MRRPPALPRPWYRGRPAGAALLLSAAVLAASCDRGGGPTTAEQVAGAVGEQIDRAHRERTLDRLEQLRTALTRYAIDHDGAVPEGSSLGSISAELSPRYLPMVPAEDGWGNTMSYASDGRSYSIVSAGADGISGSADDIALRDGAVSQGS
ncbi:MAG TPA: type II secretion system protein GspG [Candidatus Polarisedimenticolia bacterium]|nr:type II secretion system protein GspG [Candidatus Polarisedimenticolia bacterium]